MEFKITSPVGDDIEIVQEIPAELRHYKLQAAETHVVKASSGNMLFQHYKGKGFDIWYSNYFIKEATELEGRADIPIIELHIPFRNRFSVNWDGIAAANLYEKQFELSYTPYVNTIAKFQGGKDYHTFDIHFAFEFLEPYAEVFPLIDTFLNHVKAKEAASLMGVTKVIDPDMRYIINHMLNFEAVPIMTHSFFESSLMMLLNILFKRLSGIDPNAPEKYSPTDIEKATDVMRIIKADLSKNHSIATLAKMVATNQCTLKGCFKSVAGTTIYQYKLSTKMEAAKELLKEGYSIQDISEKVGYPDKANFSVAFTKYTGCSPGSVSRNKY